MRLLLSAAGLLATMGVMGCFTSFTPPQGPAYEPGGDWIVNAAQARQLIAAGGLTLIDARSATDHERERLAGAQHASWLSFSDPRDPWRGRLLDDAAALQQRVQALGVSATRRVLVYGDATNGWGEDGRLVWMLRTLGHTNAALVDGGFQCLAEAGVPTASGAALAPAPGDFVIKRDDRWSVSRDELRGLVTSSAASELVVADTRERREYEGQTPYGEQRGGHLPGAVHLHYRDLLNSLGKLYDRASVLAALAQRGITPDKEVIVYCTGGVRSAWLVVLLMDLGFTRARNYAGSMWEWSALPAEQYPLE
jgi:thiosulfate/3-mercaptopyruvate sulfurtransferase